MTWPKKSPLAMVEWDDAASVTRWIDEKEAPNYKPSLIRSVGWIVHREKKHIVIVSSENNNRDYGDPLTIPKGCIRKITIIKEPKEAQRPKGK